MSLERTPEIESLYQLVKAATAIHRNFKGGLRKQKFNQLLQRLSFDAPYEQWHWILEAIAEGENWTLKPSVEKGFAVRRGGAR